MKNLTAEETGIGEMRALVNMAGYSAEYALDGLTLEQTVSLLRACRALDLEVLPDQLTPDERLRVANTGSFPTSILRRLYRAEGLPETGPDWEGR